MKKINSGRYLKPDLGNLDEETVVKTTRTLKFPLFITFIFLFISDLSWSQNSLNEEAFYQDLRDEYGQKKELTPVFEKQALIALSHYPQLKQVKIRIKTKKKVPPFVSRPTVWSTFFKRPHKRTYLIIISNKTKPFLEPIIMENLPFEAQVGVLGHEFGHTADFIERKLGGMFNIMFGNLSPKYMDKFEYETDRRALEHGLGNYLLAWSEYAVKSLRINEPGPHKINGIERERYMLPNTIRRYMSEMPIYSKE